MHNITTYPMFSSVKTITVNGNVWYKAEDVLKALEANRIPERLNRLKQYVEVTTHEAKGVKYIPLAMVHTLTLVVGTTKGSIASKWVEQLLGIEEEATFH